MTIIAYSLYLILAIGMTIWVAHSLSVNGKVYLVRYLADDDQLATSVNHLLVVGFYLVNLGFISLALSQAGEVASIEGIFRFLGLHVGLALLLLGGMHFFNMGAINRHGDKIARWYGDRWTVPASPPEPSQRSADRLLD
ncbi:hypothetical protein ACR9YC_12330 [Parasphingorhabdus sp. DH2-15]|uniref:hypothetical protein n=1 Tax=Parasphingorhabdus sp. DH2-15 TaxID=3444112 RepID=UPI003F68978E